MELEKKGTAHLIPPKPAVSAIEGKALVSKREPISPETISGSFKKEGFPKVLPGLLEPFLGDDGIVYIFCSDKGNIYVTPLGSQHGQALITLLASEHSVVLSKTDRLELSEKLETLAILQKTIKPVWYRVAPYQDGVEIDLGDEAHNRVRITPGCVETIESGSQSLFVRSPVMKAMAMPAEHGDHKLLQKYLPNLAYFDFLLLIGWITYTLAHPKIATSKYVILVLEAGQGRGKSFLCNTVIGSLIDPNLVGTQLMHSNHKDLTIAGRNAHVLMFDNIRSFSPAMSDILCIASTGGATSSRALYTNDGQNVMRLHVAMVLNGIHPFITQSDLAQRCLPITLKPLSKANRKSEKALIAEFNADLPVIQKGIFELTASIMKHLPEADVLYPERMLDFSHWLAGLELALDHPRERLGAIQEHYSEALKQGQRNSLEDSLLGATVVAFTEGLDNESWSGSPSDLYQALTAMLTPSTAKSRDWPQSQIALSKRLRPLQPALLSQNIDIAFSRGKERTITISKIKD